MTLLRQFAALLGKKEPSTDSAALPRLRLATESKLPPPHSSRMVSTFTPSTCMNQGCSPSRQMVASPKGLKTTARSPLAQVGGIPIA